VTIKTKKSTEVYPCSACDRVYKYNLGECFTCKQELKKVALITIKPKTKLDF